MDSSNLHHHLHDHHTQFLVSSSSSSSATISPSCFGLAHETTPLHPTSSSINLLSHGNFNPSNRNPGAHHVDICSREMRVQNDISAPNSLNNSMAQDFGYHQYWGCGDLVGGINNNNNNNNHSGHDYGSSSSSSDSYPKFTDLLLQSSSALPVVVNNNNNNNSLGQDLNMQPTSYDLYSSNMIFPTINVSNLNQQQQSTLEMNLEALDLFSSGRFDHNLSNLYRSPDSNFSSYPGLAQLHHHHQQQSSHGCRPSSINTSTKLSEAANFSLIGGNYGGDRVIKRAALSDPAGSNSFSEPNLMMKPNHNNNNSLSHNHPPPQKKSRSDSRASCPPFKVRKEKLGDRIAALQQLVAPFGKTDTASVLMEAIGYIKFLQNQVETLSVPYMKASRNKQAERTRQQTMMNSEDQLEKKEEPGRGLRSRGLCLVPLSCLSYVTDGGGGIWPANFNGA
ncbi:transcription factor bHLH110-like [Impatiens glandulifera]|uniref:transcription factor bHLH110-like n=1 Tax=Impatiens glandulifera TaxID=253017 RepID=UPI001FB0FA22|nr:transcription factor bHLH110-like [Impatiens glandulifera]